MRNRMVIALLAAVVLLAAAACAPGPALVTGGASAATAQPPYRTIGPEEARDMMRQNQEYILLDVRTQEEYDEAHIAGAVLLPDYQIAENAAAQLPDKEAVILVYCRSGRRSAAAAQMLAAMGYANVYDFGGILDWPYDTVTR